MKKRLIITLLFSTFMLASCDNSITQTDKATGNTKDDNIKELIEEYSGDKTTKQSASVTATELIITEDDGEETTYDLPEDEFFVSIAPFINETHPCTNHSLTGCQGELTSESFDVYIEDSEGNVLYQEVKKTGANGFIDLWLPRNDTFIVEITQENKRTEEELSTFDDSPTCITTMQLS